MECTDTISLADEPSLRPVPMMLGAYPAGPGWPGRNHGAPAACAAGRGCCIAHAAPKGAATGAPAPAAYGAACGVDASDANGVASCTISGNWYDIRPAAPGVPIDGRADRAPPAAAAPAAGAGAGARRWARSSSWRFRWAAASSSVRP